MEHVKIAFFDIDGTLIDMDTKVMSEKMLYTLQQLKADGVIICLATGRSPVGLPRLKDITFDAYLTFNGSYCYTKNEKIYSNPLLPEDVNTIIDNAKKKHRPAVIATASQWEMHQMN